MRIFIAFQASEEVKREVVRVQSILKERLGAKDVKWVDEQNIHGTVLFVGEVPEEKIAVIECAVRAVADTTNNLEFQLDNVGAFPNLREPRVLVIRLIDFSGLGERLSARLSESVSACGLTIDEKLWKAHLTLGRVKTEGFKIHYPLEIKENRIRWQVNSIELIKSEPGINGSKYTVLKNFSLKK